MRLSIGQFLHDRDKGGDTTFAVYQALKQCRADNCTALLFPKSTYHFWPDKALERHVYISNHDEGGLRRIAFPIFDMHDLTIDGQGSEFIFHGPMIPFMLENAERLTLKNLTIDWERPMFEQGAVVEAGADFFDIQMPSDVDYRFIRDRLVFAFGHRQEEVWGFDEIDPATRAHAYQSGDRISWDAFKELKLSEIGPGRIRAEGPLRHRPSVGSVLAMRFGRRENPGIMLKDCSSTRIERVAIHHAPGMGLVAQRCTDIRLHAFDVKLRAGTNRLVTATADATHFANCRGLIELSHCLFENQLDDPCNVHGIYGQITELISEDTVLVKLVHEMQKGVEIVAAGDAIRFARHDSLIGYAKARARKTERISGDYFLLSLDDLPDGVKVGDVIENMTWIPDLEVRHCEVRANRARGFLITTAGEVLLENNTISAPGAGIKISGDANSWYESGAVRDVTIRGNTFLDCNYCCPDWGRAVIDIDPEIENPEAGEEYYHRNIRIENNEFRTFDTGLVYGHSIDGFIFRNNKISASGGYPRHHFMKRAIELGKVRNVRITGNEAKDGPLSMRINGQSLLEGDAIEDEL